MERFIRIARAALLLCVVTVLLGALSLETTGAKAATVSGKISPHQFSSNACKWSIVSSPNVPNTSNGLIGVAAISANNIWAVGGSGTQTSIGLTLIEHWNGTQWQIVSSPSPSPMYNILYSVAAISANNVWAVGFYANNSGVTQTLAEHWNGTQWSVVSSPSPASINNELYSVTAVSSNNVWAVGFTSTNSAEQTLTEHWNGTQWSVVKSRSVSNSDFLSGVAAVSTSNVWAVGASNTFAQTLTEQWNGTRWNLVKSPGPGSSDALNGVAAASASDVWAAGYTFNGSTNESLIEHWTGTKWLVVKHPNVGSSPDFSGVAAASASDVWVVGSDHNSNNVFLTLTEHWNGTQWSVVKSPSPGSFSSQLNAVAAVSASNVWAVGGFDGNTLIEHYHC